MFFAPIWWQPVSNTGSRTPKQPLPLLKSPQSTVELKIFHEATWTTRLNKVFMRQVGQHV